MDSTWITTTPIGIILLTIGSVLALAAVISVIVQAVKSKKSDKSMYREIYGTDKAPKVSHSRAARPISCNGTFPKRSVRTLEERFRQLGVPFEYYSFTGAKNNPTFTFVLNKRLFFYIFYCSLDGEVSDKRLFLKASKACHCMFIYVIDCAVNGGCTGIIDRLTVEERKEAGLE